ncbi:MAG: prepilin-type N-terminal cleavage/methylation domain-containing protein [Deltaproteobacteria bacterium]|nr:prepilin-type N-terminal cleavage/methylation domain-containing protein [Deltaproteobacteria bacterium]
MKAARLHDKRGFTLIELAIVLVIIGLIIGAVVKGGDLIDSAKMKRVKVDVDTWMAAAYTYFDKYNALPGDDTKASARWSGAANGNGDGYFNDGNNDRPWDHLRRAGLVDGEATAGESASARPKTVYGGQYGPYFVVVSWWPPQSNAFRVWLPAQKAQEYDEKYDNGTANTGNIRRWDGRTNWTDSPENGGFWLDIRMK